MPNINNIEAPVTLISYGRSGSSLLSMVFQLHPEFSMVGETGGFTSRLWSAYELTTGVTNYSIDNKPLNSEDERAGRMVRASFLSCFPDDKKQWFHKPIGVPSELFSKFNEEEWDKAATWYWNVINTTFPKARFFTILRHPFDVVLSAKSFWGYDESAIWWNLGFMSYLLLHPLCPIKYAISYEEMMLNPESIIKSLFDFLEVPFHEDVMHAFTKVHAASKDREQLISGQFTRKDEWSDLDKGDINPKYLDTILNLFNKYNKHLDLPSDDYAGICQEFNNKSAANNNHEPVNNIVIQEIISEQNKKIEIINYDNAKKLNKIKKEFYESQREFNEIFNRNQKRMTEFQEEKQWLESRFNEREREFNEIFNRNLKWMAELEEGKQWLESQRAGWENIATELTSRLHESDAKLDKIRNYWAIRCINFLCKMKFF